MYYCISGSEPIASVAAAELDATVVFEASECMSHPAAHFGLSVCRYQSGERLAFYYPFSATKSGHESETSGTY